MSRTLPSRKLLTALMAVGTAACINSGCTNTTQQELDTLFTSIFSPDEPGAAVLVMQGDDVIFDHGYGLADLEKKTAIDGDTFFNIASCSKQFTSTAVLLLVSQGLISLDDEMVKYFPEYSDPVWKGIKIRHLLSHSSGIPDERGYLTKEQRINGDESLALEYLDSLDHLHFAPGTEYEYINPTFVLLGRLVERVTGEEFTQFVRRTIFTPAGMEKTLYFDRDHQDIIPSMAHGYEYENVDCMPEERTATASEGPKDWYEYDFGEETFFATRPDGGIYTSTHEFVNWEKALRQGSVLSADLLAEAWTPRVEVSGSTFSDYQNRPGTWYGYGWFIEPREDSGKGPVIYHTGDNGGFKILAARYPASETLVLIFANRADWDRYEVKTRVEEILGI